MTCKKPYCTFGTLDANDMCTYERKLCVTCSTRDNKVYIRAQTNNLPNHCMSSGRGGNPTAQVVDFEVRWMAPTDSRRRLIQEYEE